MADSVTEYKKQGSHEYVLEAAGLVKLDHEDTLHTTPLLNSCFMSPPSWDRIHPALVGMVTAQAYEDSGFLSAEAPRNAAVDSLQEQGMTEAGRVKLLDKIKHAAEMVRQEINTDRRRQV